ncbi:hypothetical protein KUTeg_005552 [Tegillarca granosa]|uniref:RRM domain-containing protein n=1 Tax=Tegillarca granosa TaxID=220873 RepID=A0ABQ9FK10_TEGGR|nr:hypothetical protein KUTeg_005552 [Tegillarca granosa]
MAEAPKRSQVKSKFNLSKILKAFKRKFKRKGETENEDKDDVQTTTQFETSGLYSEIPAAASCKEHPYFQNSDNDVYLEPKRTDEQPYYSKALVSSDYLRPVFSDPSEHEIGGVFALPSARQAEQHRISEILKKQEVTDKTLFVNYEDPPEIPKRLTLPSPIKDGQQCAVTPRTVSADAAIGDSIPINLFENKEFDSQETGKDEDKTVVFRTDGTLSNEQNGSESLYRSSDFIEDVEADYDKTDNLVATSETLQNKNYSDDTKTISNMSKSIFLCVQNISPETTDETLSNYFEVISNKIGYPVDVSDIVHGKEGTAVIQLTGVIDFSKLSEELKKRPLENSVLQVCEVTNVNSAVISGEHSMPADNTIRNHFENDFGHVINVADIDIGMKVITFQDSSAARKICTQRNHNINETVLTVSLLYECAFGKMWDFKLHNLQQLPCDIQIKEIQAFVRCFYTLK